MTVQLRNRPEGNKTSEKHAAQLDTYTVIALPLNAMLLHSFVRELYNTRADSVSQRKQKREASSY